MNKIKNALYGAVSVALAVAPAIASAQAPAPAAGTGWDAGRENAVTANVPDGTIMGIIGATMNWLLAILGFLGIIGFVIAGILYLTAAGNEDQAEKAKSTMMYSIFGVIVALLGFVVIQAVETWLGAGSDF